MKTKATGSGRLASDRPKVRRIPISSLANSVILFEILNFLWHTVDCLGCLWTQSSCIYQSYTVSHSSVTPFTIFCKNSLSAATRLMIPASAIMVKKIVICFILLVNIQFISALVIITWKTWTRSDRIGNFSLSAGIACCRTQETEEDRGGLA